MSRTRTSVFNMDRLAQECAGDDIEALLIQNIGAQLEQLWPSTLRPPSALIAASTAICALIDWNSRSPRGKAIMRRRILQLIADLTDVTEEWGPNDLSKNAHALQVVPGLVAAMREDEQTALVDGGDLADEVASWLAGDD